MAYMPIRPQFNNEIKQKISEYVYTHDLQMYSVPPQGEIKFEELQQWCVDRLRVLKLVEQVSRQNYRMTSKYYVTILIEKLVNNGLHDFARLIRAHNYKSQNETEQRLRRNDCISHLILMSIFCFKYKEKKWFFKQEVKLFRWRLSLLNKDGIKAFNSANGLQYSTISEEEKQKIIEDVKRTYWYIKNIDNMKVYTVHFTSVINEVMKRQIFLRDGIAYVPETKMSWLILSEFKKQLNEGFTYSRQTASNIYNDGRLTKLVSILSTCNKTSYFKYNRRRRVSIKELDKLSKTSYPLCMRVLHEALKAKHHLTNGGRVQYCLFLKGIGLRLKNALRFWENEFTKKITKNTFQRKYRYTIRHLYGQEGKRAKYEPFHCIKILNSTVGLRDNHGCPFKCMTLDELKDTLIKCGLVRSDVESVMQLSKNGFYLEACKEYYEITHNCITRNTFDHPNVYFNYSCKMFESMYSDTGN
ncbi:DNA primase large subunit isoform X2 [Colletes latitarsis]|uniref:DNA primase large subunit isoform X2 n=1 Tax=Colletes latitarsis TaxID=2605962 RepID=UPI004036FEED